MQQKIYSSKDLKPSPNKTDQAVRTLRDSCAAVVVAAYQCCLTTRKFPYLDDWLVCGTFSDQVQNSIHVIRQVFFRLGLKRKKRTNYNYSQHSV